MSNINQNNKIRGINKELSLLQDSLNINEKSLNQFKNGLKRIGRLRLKKGKKKQIFQKLKQCKKHWRIYLIVRLIISKKKNDLIKNAQKRKII